MAFSVPPIGERIICKRDNVGFFATANPQGQQLKINTAKERELRGFRVDETMGTVVDGVAVTGSDGTDFLKIRYVLYMFVKTGLFGQGFFAPQLSEGYIKLSDEPDGWVRSLFEPAKREVDQQLTITDEVTAYFSGLSGVPKPTAVYKKTTGDVTATWLDFANGYTVEFEVFKRLTPATKITNTTRDLAKSAVLRDSLTDNALQTSSSTKTLFTTTNILISIGILALLGVIGILVFKKKPRT